METTTIVSTALPVALGLIMLGLGLTLKVEDFTRILKFPKPVLVGLAVQMLVLPLMAWLLCKAFSLPPELAIGLMILSASPGGATANIFSHLADGDVALNLTLTAINSVLAAVTLPLIVGLSIEHFAGENRSIGLQFSKFIEVFFVVLIPVVIGMFIHAKSPAVAAKANKPFRIFSLLVLVAIVVGAVTKEWAVLSGHFVQLGGVVILFNLLSLGVGYVLPMTLKLARRQAIAIAMEIGIHNSTLAIYIAVSVLGELTLAIPAALYSLVMFFTAAIFSVFLKSRVATE